MDDDVYVVGGREVPRPVSYAGYSLMYFHVLVSTILYVDLGKYYPIIVGTYKVQQV